MRVGCTPGSPARTPRSRTLDARKDEAIVRTFKGVVKHFKDVFAELVPHGSATMSIVTTHDVERRASEAAAGKKGRGKAAKAPKKKGGRRAAKGDGEDDEEDDDGDDDADDGGGDAAGGLVLEPEDEDEEAGGDDEEEYGSTAASRAKAAARRSKGGGVAAAGALARGSSAASSVADWAADIETFAGLAVAVSFTAGGESKDMKRLSGGQKALVALALIFAIQVSGGCWWAAGVLRMVTCHHSCPPAIHFVLPPLPSARRPRPVLHL